MTQPTLYIPHGGGPCFFMEWDPPEAWNGMERYLREVAKGLPRKPDAIIVISAHWEEEEFTLTAHASPPLIFDYYGFPAHTYKLTYPALGAPTLAGKTAKLLKDAGLQVRLDATRGFDHGVFIPFLLIFPDADIPIIQLSLKRGLDPATHLAAGNALAPLRAQNILIVGSGMSYHNLRHFGPEAAGDSEKFDGWLTKAATTPDANARSTALANWQNAPAARLAHPREEHLIPLMVAAGAAGESRGVADFHEPVMGMMISAYRFDN